MVRGTPESFKDSAGTGISNTALTVTQRIGTTVTGYTGAPMDALLNVAIALQDAFAFEDVLGHDDVRPGREVDPGPLVPMQSIRAGMSQRL